MRSKSTNFEIGYNENWQRNNDRSMIAALAVWLLSAWGLLVLAVRSRKARSTTSG
jgi:hypothetical protein